MRVAIIGAGFSGLASAHALLQVGIDDFVVFERSESIGGVWYDTTYPGAEVDNPSSIYSFSFHRFDWTRTHAQQPEILRYLHETAILLGVEHRIRTGSTVTAATWNERDRQWIVQVHGQEPQAFDAVISAVGFLNVPHLPTWAHNPQFEGRVIHSSQWPADLDLSGRRVGVVGTGSTAVQIVPEAARSAQQVTVFQRQPNWVLPKNARDFGSRERWLRHRRLVDYAIRAWNFYRVEFARLGGRHLRPGSDSNRRMQRRAERHLRDILGDRQDLVASVTPTYPIQSKRPVVNDDYYRALLEPHVTVCADSVARLERDGVVDQAGTSHTIDTMILATGFSAQRFLQHLEVVGRDGLALEKYWEGEPSAYLGVSVPGFPNFFMLYGPNTNATPVVYLLERQARLAARGLAAMAKRGAREVEVRPGWDRRYNTWVQRALATTVWSDQSIHNYYRSDSGRVVTQWPRTATLYAVMARLSTPWSWMFRR